MRTLTQVVMCGVLLTGSETFATDAGRRPNVVFILTDNHSAWTLGCYGNKDIRTPNIDRLAAEGMRFGRCFSSNAVCSPTRATYLTGLMPSQHGVHSYLGTGSLSGPSAHYMLSEFRTLPKILGEAGYTCGLAGKWHLGDCLYPQDGFTYWVTKPGGHTSTFYNADVIENGAVRKEPTYLMDFWTRHAVRFIEQNKDRSFFLYLPYNGPYGLGSWLKEPGRNRHVSYYADKELPCFPREPVHAWLRSNRQFVGNLTAMRRYSAEVSGVDDGVGEVMATLKRLGLDENTLVVFAADQGLAGGHNGVWGMADHGRPLHTFDSALHIPLIWRQPKRIPAGGTSDILVSNYDFMPTLLSYLGLADRMAKSPESPGHDYSPVLRGDKVPWNNEVFYEYENSRMIRTDRWKLTLRFPNGPDELYDLASDPGEKHNLIDEPGQAGVQRQLRQRLEAFFKRYADPKYDLWRGGISKAPLVVMGNRRTKRQKASPPTSSPARISGQR
ncbi:MAG: sulfatase-like hydrolase/transferase [Phycisphaerae bacterium]|nr:sulfatase-like hydrolase/transferase [Phycisphaerae bacterium]